MGLIDNRNHQDRLLYTTHKNFSLPLEQVAHSSREHTLQGSSDQAVPYSSEQVAPSAPQYDTDHATENAVHPAANHAAQVHVEIEEIIPSIESPTENLPNDDDYATDPTGLAEPELRRRAVAWMERTYSHLPNGTIVQPPSYFRRTRSSPAGRPAVWIKDFVWGHIRPRRLTNDRLANMPLARRERWARSQRRECEEEGDEDGEGESEEEGD
ncbi:hypothetical protein B0H65DRAFT_558663 [Neurospora tetraspora]|uniref:Uncharacterized protein n=1 Tax=Neurospora tetraspora TaxID=94610 RepID=A0AAE0MQ41_9PEZI|nr:hypothetical protein B0H65DRAFT_558663 [Neurospora tetraspora]